MTMGFLFWLDIQVTRSLLCDSFDASRCLPVLTSIVQCTRRITVVCRELGIDYKVAVIDIFKGVQKEKEFLSKQPFGQIPVIDVGFS